MSRKGHFVQKMNFFKELKVHIQTYELRGHGEKNKNKIVLWGATPHPEKTISKTGLVLKRVKTLLNMPEVLSHKVRPRLDIHLLSLFTVSVINACSIILTPSVAYLM